MFTRVGCKDVFIDGLYSEGSSRFESGGISGVGCCEEAIPWIESKMKPVMVHLQVHDGTPRALYLLFFLIVLDAAHVISM